MKAESKKKKQGARKGKSNKYKGRPSDRRALKNQPFSNLERLLAEAGIDKDMLKSARGGRKVGEVSIWLNPFMHPRAVPVRIFRNRNYDRAALDTLRPLPYDVICSDERGYWIKERRNNRVVIYLDEKGITSKVHGMLPYLIAVKDPVPSDACGKFWSVKLPVEQAGKRDTFRVELDKEFEQTSVLHREVEMVKFNYDLPDKTPDPTDGEVEGYGDFFKEAVKPEKLIIVEKLTRIEDLDENAERYDLRQRLVYTIDSEETKDIDDAIEVVKLNKDLYIFGIHIADVSEFVKEASSRDDDAKNRGTSHYLADKVVHMLPECLSQQYCSLKENKDRLSVSVYAEIEDIGNDFVIKGVRFCRSLIESKDKLNYIQVNHILKNISESDDDPIHRSLADANDLARLIEAHSPYKDISFFSDNVKYYADRDGTIARKDESFGASNTLIEMFMITANRLVGEKIADMIISTSAEPRGVGVYRIQPTPGEQDLRDYISKLQAAGLIGKQVEYDKIKTEVEQMLERDNKLKQRLSEKEKEIAIRSGIYRLIVQDMDSNDPVLRTKLDVLERYAYKSGRIKAKADLSGKYEKSYHYSLGINRYAWFTSPIRRYSDIVNHRQLKSVLSVEQVTKNNIDVGALSKKFKNAGYAENGLNRRLLMYYLRDQHNLLNEDRLLVMVSSFQWVMSNRKTIELQGIWKDLYPLNFVFKKPPFAQIRDDGLTCELNNKMTLHVGDMISINMKNRQDDVSPDRGNIYIQMDQIEKR